MNTEYKEVYGLVLETPNTVELGIAGTMCIIKGLAHNGLTRVYIKELVDGSIWEGPYFLSFDEMALSVEV